MEVKTITDVRVAFCLYLLCLLAIRSRVKPSQMNDVINRFRRGMRANDSIPKGVYVGGGAWLSAWKSQYRAMWDKAVLEQVKGAKK